MQEFWSACWNIVLYTCCIWKLCLFWVSKDGLPCLQTFLGSCWISVGKVWNYVALSMVLFAVNNLLAITHSAGVARRSSKFNYHLWGSLSVLGNNARSELVWFEYIIQFHALRPCIGGQILTLLNNLTLAFEFDLLVVQLCDLVEAVCVWTFQNLSMCSLPQLLILRFLTCVVHTNHHQQIYLQMLVVLNAGEVDGHKSKQVSGQLVFFSNFVKFRPIFTCPNERGPFLLILILQRVFRATSSESELEKGGSHALRHVEYDTLVCTSVLCCLLKYEMYELAL